MGNIGTEVLLNLLSLDTSTTYILNTLKKENYISFALRGLITLNVVNLTPDISIAKGKKYSIDSCCQS